MALRIDRTFSSSREADWRLFQGPMLPQRFPKSSALTRSINGHDIKLDIRIDERRVTLQWSVKMTSDEEIECKNLEGTCLDS